MANDDIDSPWQEGLVRNLPRFFEFFFPQIHGDVDWSKPARFLDKELQAVAPTEPGRASQGARIVDTLVDLKQTSGRRVRVLVHIEVQAQKVHQFEKRMLLYHTRLMDRFHKPICSLVILADKNTKWRPSSYHHELWGNTLNFHFPGRKLLDFRDEVSQLEQSTNPFALLTAATLHAQSTKQDSDKRRAVKRRMVRGLLRSGLSKKDIQAFFRLIDWVLRLSLEQEELFEVELEEMEKETKMPYITSIERRGIEKGLEQGLEQGRTVGRAEALLDVLKARFGELPGSVEEKVKSHSDLERFRELSRLVVTAATLEDFEKELH